MSQSVSQSTHIFRITTKYGSKITDRKIYQSKPMFDKWWKNKIDSQKVLVNYYHQSYNKSIELVAEQLLDEGWVQIDCWTSK
jgi:hypothetical protein